MVAERKRGTNKWKKKKNILLVHDCLKRGKKLSHHASTTLDSLQGNDDNYFLRLRPMNTFPLGRINCHDFSTNAILPKPTTKISVIAANFKTSNP